MPLTNGALIDALVEKALDKDTQLNLTGISEDGGGDQPHGFAARQLLNARNGEDISRQKLKLIAKRLGDLLEEEIDWKALVRAQEDETAGADVAARGGKTMIAKSKKNAPAVNAEQGASVSININSSPKG